MPTVMRTREQEARFAELNRMYNTVIMLPDQLDERASLSRMTAYTPTPTVRTAEQEARLVELRSMDIPPRTYVRVHRDQYNTWNVSVKVGTENRDLPSIAVIKSLLNPADKHFLPSRQGRYRGTLGILRIALNAGLSAQSLHDALRAWVMATENRITEAESSIPATGIDEATSVLLRAQPATLEVGGRVFRLVPSNEVDVRPLITRVRQRTIAQARVETDALRERARTDARVLTTEAERQAARTRAEAEEIARRAGAKVPDWVRDSGRPHYYSSGYWNVELRVNCYLRDIRFLVREWGTILHWKPIVVANHNPDWYAQRKCPLWFRVSEDGRYDKNSITSGDWDTPHIGSFMCMELQNQPPVIKEYYHLINLEKAISRGMQVLNLNSPLSRAVDNYFPAIKEQIPVIPIKMLRGDVAIQPESRTLAMFREANPSITWDSAETLAEENNGVFSVDNPVPVLSTTVDRTQLQEVAEMIQRAQVVVVRGE